MARTLPDELQFLQNRKAKQKETNLSMKGKVVVLTGSTSGVGYQAALQFAKGGAHLVMINRNSAKAATLKNQLEADYAVSVDSFIGEFSNLHSVERVAQDILAKYPRIDVLVNCAGMHSTKRTWTTAGFETVFCVNHLASFLLTMHLLPRLKESAPSRIIQVNSEGHRFNGLRMDDLHWKKRFRYTGLKSYGASKSAQLLTVFEWAKQLNGTGVTINAMHPGDVKTNIGQNNGWLYRWFSKWFISRLLDHPEKSGKAIYYLAASEEVKAISGRFFHLTIDEKPANHVLNDALGQTMFQKTLQMVTDKRPD